jgi:bifunctional non-homologous end joining protein LigD
MSRDGVKVAFLTHGRPAALTHGRPAAGATDADTVAVDEPALPEPVAPMLATAGQVPRGPGWAFEFKWDGVRAVVATAGASVRLTSRLGNDVTAGYPELGGIGALTGGRPALLDGEIVALDAAGRPNFGLLQDRMHVRHPTPELQARIPVSFYAFDLLHLDGRSLLAAPYDERRARLAELEPAGRALVPPSFPDVDGVQLLEIARGHGLEGVVAKRRAARYEPGRRSPAWVKTALVRTLEVLIGGWTPGEGRRARTFGSLLLGAHGADGRLRYLGHVGTGFSDAALDQLTGRLRPLLRRTSPFDETVPREHARLARWVEPVLVGEVEYRLITRDGRLRHASWRGLRPDRAPDEVVLPVR